MRFSLKIATQLITNALAFLVALFTIPGFSITPPLLPRFILVITLFTLINLFLRPIFTIIFGPLILFTFGLFTLIINGMLLLILDYLSSSITIQGIGALGACALIISIMNLIASTIMRAFKIKK